MAHLNDPPISTRNLVLVAMLRIERDGGVPNCTIVSDMLERNHSTICGHVSDLVERGFIERRKHGRNMMLTRRGSEAAERIESRFSQT